MIFVVDDDARIRTAAAEALRGAGYVVRDFGSGIEALAALGSESTLRLIVSDVQMPEMNGPEFIREALLLRPDLTVHYMSGDVGETPFEALAPWPLLAKPFTANSLVKAVVESLA
jgi:two-component system, cell cycle sensor histidine kinase and response regulator CckA